MRSSQARLRPTAMATRNTHAKSSSISSTKHQPQFSPGSMDLMIGCLEEWKCFVACLFFDESQQPTWPHIRHSRKCTQVSPIFKQSSQPFALGVTSLIWSRCVHCFAISFFLPCDTPVT